MHRPPIADLTTDFGPGPERPGMRVGPYKLLQFLGEGGMGTVFLAEQTEPVRRMVALKIIKPGMDSSQVLARFEAEDRDLARDAETRAVAEKANAQGALRFLLADVLEQADPYHERDRDLTVRTLLDRATDRLEKNTALPPLIEAAIRQTMGKIYWGLGEFEKGEPQLTRAYALQQKHAGEDDPDTLHTAFHLATLYRSQTNFSKAEPLFRRVLEGRRRLYGDDHPETLRATHGLGTLFNHRGQNRRAEPLFVQALEAGLRAHGDRHRDTLLLMSGLGSTYHGRHLYDKAEPLLVRALKGQRAILGDKHPETLSTRETLARVYFRTDRLPEAEREALKAFHDRLEVFGEMHPLTLNSQGNLVAVYLAQGRRGDADPLLRGFREKAQRQQHRLSAFGVGTLSSVGQALLREGDFVEAESFLRLYLDVAAKQQLREGWQRSSSESALGACLLGQKKYAEAEPLLLKGYEGLRQHEDRIPANRRQILLTEALEQLVQLCEATHKPDEAARWRKELEARKGKP